MPKGELINSIFYALLKNRVQDVKPFLNKLKKCKPDEQYDYDITLELAASRGQLEILKKLIETNANINYDSELSTPLRSAVASGHIDCVVELINAGAEVNYQSNSQSRYVLNDTGLHDAVRLTNVECIKRLLDAGANVNIKNKLRDTPLDLQMYFGRRYHNQQITILLLAHHASVNDFQKVYHEIITSKLPDMNVLSATRELLLQNQLVNKLTKDQIRKLNKIIQLNELHQNNISRSVDRYTGEKIPIALLEIVREYLDFDVTLKNHNECNIHTLFKNERAIERSTLSNSHKYETRSKAKKRHSEDSEEKHYKKLRS